MGNLFQSYKTHLAQTTNFAPVQLEIEKAEGLYLYDKEGKKYIDLISGVAVNNLGHRHPKIMEAVQKQLDKYLHIMVYGEFVQKETVKLAEKLGTIDRFTNIGTEILFMPNSLNGLLLSLKW